MTIFGHLAMGRQALPVFASGPPTPAEPAKYAKSRLSAAPCVLARAVLQLAQMENVNWRRKAINLSPPDHSDQPRPPGEELARLLRGIKAWYAASGEIPESPRPDFPDSADSGTAI